MTRKKGNPALAIAGGVDSSTMWTSWILFFSRIRPAKREKAWTLEERLFLETAYAEPRGCRLYARNFVL